MYTFPNILTSIEILSLLEYYSSLSSIFNSPEPGTVGYLENALDDYSFAISSIDSLSHWKFK